MGWLSKTPPEFSGVFAYLTTPVVVNVPTAGVYVPITGTFSNSPIDQFHMGTNAIVYDDGAAWFEILWSATFSSEDAGRTVHFGVSINGEVLTEASSSIMAMYAKYAAEDLSLSGVYTVWLSAGSTVSLQLTSTTNDDNVTVSHFTTSIKRMFQ